jgi:hypothetical protein
MSYTPTYIRQVIDDLDFLLRAGVQDGTVEQVFKTERKAIVSAFIFIYFQ